MIKFITGLLLLSGLASAATTTTVGEKVLMGKSASSVDTCLYSNTGLSNRPSMCYDKSGSKWIFSNDGVSSSDVGSGGGSLDNYISNPGAESTVSPWSAYADAAGTTPVNGTGGSPTLTITRNTTTPLKGSGDFLITKDAADRQGEGVSYDFSIDDSVKNANGTVRLSFDFTASANFVPGSSSDVRMFIYDVTNAAVITPSVSVIGVATGSFATEFYPSATSSSYRLIFHIATTNALAWTFRFDNVSVAPLIADFAPQVAYVSDVKSQGTNGGTPTTSAWTARDLNTLENPGNYTWISVASDQITLSKRGVYEFNCLIPSNRLGSIKNKIYNDTDAADAIVGMNGYGSPATAAVDVISSVVGQVSISSSKNFEVQYWTDDSQASPGLGLGKATNITGYTEKYSQCVISKIK